MFFGLQREVLAAELMAVHPMQFVGMYAANEAEYTAHDDEDRLNWRAVDSRWETEAFDNDAISDRGAAEAFQIHRKYARFGMQGNRALAMREAEEIKELMADIKAATDDLILGIPGPGDPIRSLAFVRVGA